MCRFLKIGTARTPGRKLMFFFEVRKRSRPNHSSASIKFKIFKCSQSLIFSTLSSFWHLETPLGNNIWTNRTFDQRIIVIYREFWHQNLCNICHIWHFTSIYSIKYYCIRNLETQNCPVSSLYYQRKVHKSGHRILIRVNQFL